MKKKSKKQKLIEQRLEFFDIMVKELRKRVEAGDPIPSVKVLIQPE